jgi:tRNA threonylcarbamoyladenosine biosynthesis protein TsaE
MSPIRLTPAVALTASAALLLVAAGTSSPAMAHPHVWITDVTTFLLEGPQLAGLRHRWQFDEFFSSFVIEEHDADGNGEFEPAELAGVQAGAFSNLAEYGYFTHARLDGEPVALDQVEDFQATIADGILIYEFTLPLPEPVDPAAVSVAVGVYDAEYSVEVLLDQDDPVRFRGMEPEACIFDIREDTENAIYFGMVHPLLITLHCVVS